MKILKVMCIATAIVCSLANMAHGHESKGTILPGAIRSLPGGSADSPAQELKNVGAMAFTASDYKIGEIKHVVLFRYKKNVTATQREAVKQRFFALKDSAKRNNVAYIESVLTGSQNSGEAASHGFEQAFIVTFRSQGDRNYYVGTPIVTDSKFYDAAHQRFKEFVGPLLRDAPDGVLVFDFAVENR